MRQPPIGSHLVTPRTGYSHHGIYIGDGKVIHYSGLATRMSAGPIEETDLQSFSANRGFTIKTYKSAFPHDKIVQQAQSRLGENSYDVFNNNCEHFCLWCIVGDHTSAQVDRATWVGAPSASAMVGLAARGVIASSGVVAGLSGAGIMSGLAATGAVIGGGAVAGIGVLGAVPGAAMASLVNKTVLADNPALDAPEKNSRRLGRAASYVGAGAGAGAGTAGSIAAVSAMGTTAGLSAAGITSGLAAIGGTVGGGMAAGVVVASAAPVAAAAAIGYGAYKIVRWLKK